VEEEVGSADFWRFLVPARSRLIHHFEFASRDLVIDKLGRVASYGNELPAAETIAELLR
jgi:hypothetical protein